MYFSCCFFGGDPYLSQSWFRSGLYSALKTVMRGIAFISQKNNRAIFLSINKCLTIFEAKNVTVNAVKKSV